LAVDKGTKTKKEQNKKASQKYRLKKREKEENMQAALEQLKQVNFNSNEPKSNCYMFSL